MSDLEKAAKVHANSMAVCRDVDIGSLAWSEYQHDFLAGAAWQRKEYIKIFEYIRTLGDEEVPE